MSVKENGLKPGMNIPYFSLDDVSGNTIISSHLEGRPFLLYFMRGTW